MRTAATKRLPLLAVQSRRRDREGLPAQDGGRGRRKQSPRPSSKGGHAFAFLSEGLKDIPISGHLDKYDIDFAGSYKVIRKAMNRFLAPHDLKITYRPKRSEDSVKRLEYLMENFEALLDPMGFGCMLHKDEYEPILDCAVYACSDAMDYTIGELYVRPADTLPETESMLFKRFMSFFSSQTNIGLGLNGDSFFLEAQADYFFDEYGDYANFDELDEDEKKDALFRKQVITDYKTGRYKQLFDEIGSLPVDGEVLASDLLHYIEKYRDVPEKSDVWQLIKVLYEGIDIAYHINIYDWTWNPESDGVSDDDDNYYTATSLLNFIFYSEYDTFGESVLDAVNNGSDEMLGWCSMMTITCDKNFHDRQEYFESCIGYVPKFRDWLRDFYQTAEKFDTNEYDNTERPNEG